MEPVKPSAATDRSHLYDQLARWLDDWRRMEPLLESERTRELQALTDEDAARIAVDLVWPMGTLGDDPGGDDGAGLEVIVALQQAQAGRR
jgi:hypothetical protein